MNNLFGGNNNQKQPSGFSVGSGVPANRTASSTNVTLFGNNSGNQGGIFSNNMGQSNNIGMSGNTGNSIFGGGSTTNSVNTVNNAFPGNTNQMGNTGNSIFGNTSLLTTPSKTQPSSSIFNNNMNANNNIMGQNQNKTSIFGGQPNTSTNTGGVFNSLGNFGGTNSTMGIMNTNNSNNLINSFNQVGQTTQTMPINPNNPGTFEINFAPVPFAETISSGNNQKTDTNKLWTITGHPELSNKSLEELKREDYMLKKTGKTYNKPIQQGFGVQNSNPSGLENKVSNLVSGLSGTSQNIFGSNNNSNNILGGQTQNTNSIFAQNTQTGTGGSIFNNINQQQTTGNQNTAGLFNKPSTGIFGNNNTSNTSSNILGGVSNNTGIFSSQVQANPNPNPQSGLFSNSLSGITANNNSSSIGQNILGGNTTQNILGSNNNSLFGGQTTTQNTGSFFGNSAQPTQTGGGLFNNNPQPAHSGGLFSNQAQTAQNTGGLFGNTPQAAQSGGLFNNSTNTGLATGNTTSSNLFGGVTTTANTNLFPSQTGLNGQAKQTSTNSSSLFGNTQPTTGGNLFGGTTTQGSSLFGSGATTGITGGGLFGGGANKLTTGLQTTTGTSSSLFGGLSSTAPQTNQILNNPSYKDIPQNILGLPMTNLSPHVINALHNQKSIQEFVDLMEDEFLKEEQHGYYSSTNFNRRLDNSFNTFAKNLEDYTSYSVKKREKPIVFNNRVNDYSYYHQLYHTRDQHMFLQNKKREPVSFEREARFNRNVMEITSRARIETLTPEERRESYGIGKKRREESKDEENITKDMHEFIAYATPKRHSVCQSNVVTLLVEVMEDNLRFEIQPNINNNVELLKAAILDILKTKASKFKKITTNNLTLLVKSQIMKDTKTIAEFKLKNGDKVEVSIGEVVENGISNYKEVKSSKKIKISEPRSSRAQDIAPIEALPNLTKAEYKTEPSFMTICRMTLDQLEAVENFAIFNSHGRIEFKNPVNLVGLNLDKVNIEHLHLHLYDPAEILPAGEGLNLPCIITMNECFPMDEATEEEVNEYMDSLKEMVQKMGARFISYNREGELKFEMKQLPKK